MCLFFSRRFASRRQVRAPLMQRSCARVASHVFETRGEVLSADAFASEIASLRESVLTGSLGREKRGAPRGVAPAETVAGGKKRRERSARDDETTAFAFGDRLPGRLAALDDAASVFELYLDAAEGSDPSASGGLCSWTREGGYRSERASSSPLRRYFRLLLSGCQPARPKAAADSAKYFEVILSCTNIYYGARPHLAVRHAACSYPPRLV